MAEVLPQIGQSTEFTPAGKEETDFRNTHAHFTASYTADEHLMPPASATLTRDIRVNYGVRIILITADLVEGRQPAEKSTHY